MPLSKLSVDLFSIKQNQTGLLIGWKSCGMVQATGVQPETIRVVTSYLVNGPLQKPLAQALAYKIGY